MKHPKWSNKSGSTTTLNKVTTIQEIDSEKLKEYWNSIVMNINMNENLKYKSIFLLISDDLTDKCTELYDLYARYWIMQNYNVIGIPAMISEESKSLDELFFIDKERLFNLDDTEFNRAFEEMVKRSKDHNEGQSDDIVEQLVPLSKMDATALAGVGWPIKTQDFMHLFPYDLFVYPNSKKDVVENITNASKFFVNRK